MRGRRHSLGPMVARDQGGRASVPVKAAARKVPPGRRPRRGCPRRPAAVPVRRVVGAPGCLARLRRRRTPTSRCATLARADALDDGGRDLSASVGLALQRHAGGGRRAAGGRVPNLNPADARVTAHATPLALVAAADGTTNVIAASLLRASAPATGRGAPRRRGHPPAPRGHRARHRHAERTWSTAFPG